LCDAISGRCGEQPGYTSFSTISASAENHFTATVYNSNGGYMVVTDFRGDR